MRRFDSLSARRAVAVAGVIAIAVFVVLLVQILVISLSSTLIGTVSGSLPSVYVGMIWAGAFSSIMSVEIPLVVGIFVSVWLLAPIAAELGLASVVARAVLATGIGAVLTAVMTILWHVSGAFAGVGSLFGNAFPELPVGRIGQALSFGFQSGLSVFIQQLALVVLMAVLAWLWLRAHPRNGGASASRDEV